MYKRPLIRRGKPLIMKTVTFRDPQNVLRFDDSKHKMFPVRPF